jgi:hypothetical protein
MRLVKPVCNFNFRRDLLWQILKIPRTPGNQPVRMSIQQPPRVQSSSNQRKNSSAGTVAAASAAAAVVAAAVVAAVAVDVVHGVLVMETDSRKSRVI